MKFAKELEANLVAEWKEKYLNYKIGKKKLKAVTRALRNADKSPGPYNAETPSSNSLRGAPVYSYLNQRATNDQPDEEALEARQRALFPARSRSTPREADGDRTPRPQVQPHPINERSPLRPKGDAPQPEGRGLTRYGSILGSPPQDQSGLQALQKQASLLELPDPALDPRASRGDHRQDSNAEDERPATASAPKDRRSSSFNLPSPAQAAHSSYAHGNRDSRAGVAGALKAPRYRSVFHPKRVNSMPGDQRPFVQRMFSISGSANPKASHNANTDIALEAYRELDFRQAEFFMFLDKELEKIEDFYKFKEDQATERLKVLREQLHVMRNHRLEEIAEAEQGKHSHHFMGNGGSLGPTTNGDSDGKVYGTKADHHASLPWLVDNAVDRIDHALDKVRGSAIGKTSRAMGHLGTPHFPPERGPMDQRDYAPRNATKEVPYRAAKRKLKTALAEYYRGLELLKSYAILNRTAFRKINKKFDKAVHARPSGRYMSEHVNKAYFVNSEVVDGHIQAIEDLYARYFERGNHKLAVGKLRAKIVEGDYTGSVWRQGVMCTAGLVFGIEGLVYGAEQLFSTDPSTSLAASYLLQLYAGYFLMLLLVFFFVIDTIAFSQAKVNYQFIFEFDSRHTLNWRQLSEMPAFFLLLLGLVMWLNFQQFGGMTMYTYWPVVLIGLSVCALLLPAHRFYWRARKWFLYSNWRLALAGIYPVEFRDFFLGDMFCSQTFAMGNIELFFCLYARSWNGPAQCNSSHSRLLGFFTCLPGIWRLLQCLRRYWDTRNVFPHLVNGGKYTFTILGAMSLSLFRLNRTTEMFAFFIFCSTVNSIYCSIWDIVMDWSLGIPSAKHPFLRHKLAYKQIWWYYTALVLDPILRFNWIFYAIFAHDIQHSSIIAFAVALSEVCRRGIWTLFRVENEHCTNVGRFRASRDVPLPYEIPSESNQSLIERQEEIEDEADITDNRTIRSLQGIPEQPVPPPESAEDASEMPSNRRRSTHTSGADIERGSTAPSRGSASLRHRRFSAQPGDSPLTRTLRQVGSTMLNAHAQDYERKRKPSPGKRDIADDSDDDDDDDPAESDVDDPPNSHLDTRTSGSQRDGGRPSGRLSGRHERSAQESRDLEEALERAGRGSK